MEQEEAFTKPRGKKSENYFKGELEEQNVKPASPVSSCMSMRSGHSMDPPLKFQEELPSVLSVKPASRVSSCVSMRSDHSMDPPLKFQGELPSVPSVKPASRVSSCVSMRSGHSMDPPLKFQGESANVTRGSPASPELSYVSMKSALSMTPLENFQAKQPDVLRSGWQQRSQTLASSHASLKRDRPIDFSDNFNNLNISECRCALLSAEEFCTTLKSRLMNQFQTLPDGLRRQGHATLLNEIYTDLYITEGESGQVNNEHEVRQMEAASRIHQAADDLPIKCNDIFKPLPGQEGVIRTVLTKGIAGIGKTVSVQKFILDWADGTANRDIHFIFPLPFRELNLVTNECCLEDLLCHFFPKLKETMFTAITSCKTLFIFDGLDEFRSWTDFYHCTNVCETNIPTSVNVLLINLIKGNLLPSAMIWITSRPAAASQIPHTLINQTTEIRGFQDLQKEEYLKKSIKDENLANDVISHLKKSRSLYIMCHIPVFCWISATVLEKMLKEAEGTAVPKTLTQMYTHFLIQNCIRNEKYDKEAGQSKSGKEMIIKLGELAFKQLLKGNLIFYEEDLKECNIDVKEAVLYSGVCTQIFRDDSECFYSKRKVFCFVHLSIQEHLAALYVHIMFSKGNTTVLNQWEPSESECAIQIVSFCDLHKTAVNKALESKSGEFDLFLRFLLGISQENNQALLHMLLPQISECNPPSVQDTIKYIKNKLKEDLTPEKYMNLFHCLNELNDFSLEEEIQNFQKTRRLARTILSSSQWHALVFVLLTSGNALDVFDLRKYCMDNTDECLQKMLPVVIASRTAEVRNCDLSHNGFQALASALRSKTSMLREVKLNGNNLHQWGTRILYEGLQSPHCKLEILEVSDCSIQEEDCRILSSAFSVNPSHLRELDLSFNPIGELGVMHISYMLNNSKCGLKTLKLCSCKLNSNSCKHLAKVLMNDSSLTELDLSKNPLQHYGVKYLSDGLKHPSCKLSVLR